VLPRVTVAPLDADVIAAALDPVAPDDELARHSVNCAARPPRSADRTDTESLQLPTLAGGESARVT
jgi:hypothetical protein